MYMYGINNSDITYMQGDMYSSKYNVDTVQSTEFDIVQVQQ